MFNFLQELVFWQWFCLAAILLIIEMLTGTGVLLWFSISAAMMGCVVFLIPGLSWMVQVFAFAVIAVLTAISWKLYLKRNPIKTDKPALNRRGEQYINRVFTLDAPIINGMGHIHVDDTVWRVQCVDLPRGARVVVTGVDGVVLKAKPMHG